MVNDQMQLCNTGAALGNNGMRQHPRYLHLGVLLVKLAAVASLLVQLTD